MLPNFNSSVLTELTDEELIEIYKDIIKYKNTKNIDENSLFYKKSIELTLTSFGRGVSAKEDEYIRLELFVSMKLAEKYITEHHL